MQEFYEFVRSAWVVWLMAVFIGIIVWVLWPSRRRKYSDAANIPLDDDDEPKNRRDANEGS